MQFDPTNHGYSDWATTDIDAGVKSMWYRLSRTEFKQMRICQWKAHE